MMAVGFFACRRGSYLFIVVAVWTGCGYSAAKPASKSQHLVREFHYAMQWNFTDKRFADTFVVSNAAETLIHAPEIVQSRPGGIAFSAWPLSKATLTFRTHFEIRQPTEVRASVIIDSDFPSACRREYEVSLEKIQSIDLSEFRNRPVRIILQAYSENHERLGGTLHWIDPILSEEVTPLSPKTVAAMQDFRERHRHQNVMIVLLDAGNRSHFSFAGYGRMTTPNIDRIARESVVFDRAVAPACYTLASTGSLFTGLYPQVHGVYENGRALQESFKTLAESMREGGWDTALFSANPNVSKSSGYDQGFRYVWDAGVRHTVHATEIGDAVIQWLPSVANRRFFAYVHFREPHAPYNPPTPLIVKFGGNPDLLLPPLEPIFHPDPDLKRRAIAAYDANLACADDEFARIVQQLRNLQLDRNTILIVIADHGEAFWEHGVQGHNAQLYDEMIRIPYVLHFPDEPQLNGSRRTSLAGTIDLFPTLADLFGLTTKGFRHNGRSLLPQICDDSIVMERFLLSHNSSLSSHSLRSSSLKYVRTRGPQMQEELYELDSDPQEKINTAGRRPITTWILRMSLQRQLDSLDLQGRSLRAGQDRRAVIDKEMAEQLHALGYVQ